jgi:PAS domain S-box-containing protein
MVPEFDAEGRVESVLAIARDITARKRAELALRASETKLKRAQHEFETLADGLPQVITCFDRELRFTYANAAIERLTSSPRAELIGHTAQQAGFPLPLAESLNRSLRSVFETARPSTLDFEYPASDGTRHYEAHHIPLTSDDGGVETVLCVASDITERKRAEEERLSAMARQSDALLREVHHRVKNNLQGVVGLLRQLANMHEPLAPVLAKAVSQLQAMAVVHGLHGRDWHDGVALAGMVSEIAKSVERTTGVQVKCNNGCDDDAHLRESEAVAVALVVNELILNAAKHGATSPKGTVTVDVKADAKRAEVAVLNRGSLPAHFDFKQGDGLGTGLELVKALVPTDGASLAFSRNNGQVRATLALGSPVMVRAPEETAKEMRDEWDRRRRAYSDRRR